MVFSATSLPVKVSRARYTVPVAPLPSSFWISYLPTCRLRSTVKRALSVTWIWRVSFAATVPETDETRAMRARHRGGERGLHAHMEHIARHGRFLKDALR